MRNYWSCSKFAAWIRKFSGIPVIESGTSEDWKRYKKESKEKAPFIHWLTDKGLDKIQSFIYWPIDRIWDLRCAINARFFDKYHSLPTGLNKWEYHEVDSRLLHGMFQTLVDFIEIEKAWMNVIFGQDENQKKFGYKWYEMNQWLNWFMTDRRHPESGINYLQWEMSLIKDDDWYGQNEENIAEAKAKGEYGQMTAQGESAKEQLALYTWWKETYLKRPDPMEESGMSEYFKNKQSKYDDEDALFSYENDSEEERKTWEIVSAACHKIESDYEKEDEEMMIRLIKIRSHLWT